MSRSSLAVNWPTIDQSLVGNLKLRLVKVLLYHRDLLQMKKTEIGSNEKKKRKLLINLPSLILLVIIFNLSDLNLTDVFSPQICRKNKEKTDASPTNFQYLHKL